MNTSPAFTCSTPSSAATATLLGALLSRDCPAPTGLSLFLKDYFTRGGNALLWVALVWITLLLTRKLASLARLWALGARIPGPPCPSFFLGHSSFFARCSSPADLTGYFSRMHELYGPIVRLWLGPTELLVSVKNLAMIQEVLLQAEDRLPLAGKAFRLAFGKSSLFVSSFEKVQRRRESLAIYLHGKLLERVNAIPSKVVEHVMSRINSIMSKGILDCRLISQHLAFYVLGTTLFGDFFLDWPDVTVYEELLMIIARDGCFWASYKIPPFWRTGYWKYHLVCKRLKNLTKELIEKCRNAPDLFGENDHSLVKDTKKVGKEVELKNTTLMENVISGDFVWEEIERLLISKEEPCGNILGLMFHGCLTVASLIGSILTRLVLYPELQGKIYAEIKDKWRVCSLDKQDMQKMHLLYATIYESARLLPAGPLLQRCSFKHDMVLGDTITVPSGAIVVIPVQLVLMDNSVWGKDARKFNPYRFLPKHVTGSTPGTENDQFSFTSNRGTSDEDRVFQDKDSMLKEAFNNPAFLPFGYGTRACIGQNFTIMGIAALFATLLQNYEVKLQQGFEKEPTPTVNDSVLQLLPSPKIVFLKRSN